MEAPSSSGLGRRLATMLCFAFAVPLYAQEIPADSASIQEGEELFVANCKTCHRVKKKLIGPALAGVYDRAPSIAWIQAFVRNSSKVIASGDEYANKIYEENGKVLMTSFTSFTDEQILSILAYVKAEADKPDEVPAAAVAAGGEGAPSAALNTTYLYAILVGLILALALLLVVLGLIIGALKKYLRQQDLTEEEKEIMDSPYSPGGFFKSPGFIFAVSFLAVTIGFKTLIDGLYTIGVQRGYKPKQPIAFSHKVHAGQYGIECQYCHTGVMKSRSANIPSSNICMNCHTQIRKGTHTGEEEIAKVVASYESGTPVEWVRIHNLPDLSYFNHAQHANVGGIACQTCHGPIEEMDVVEQHALLTMGWCIDCHRKTDVNAKGNKYYDNLLDMHTSGAMKVEDIGGLECAKCHY